jgi:hypothetical protein
MVDNEQLVQDMREVYDKLRAEFDSNINGIQSKKKGSLKRAMELGKLLTEMGARISKTAKEQDELQKHDTAANILHEMRTTLEGAKPKIPEGLYAAWNFWLNIADRHTDEIARSLNLTQIKKNFEEDLQPPYLHRWSAITLTVTFPRIYGMSLEEAMSKLEDVKG